MSPHGQAALLDRSREAGFPGVRNGSSGFGIDAGESAWLLALPRLSEAQGRDVVRLLDQVAASAQRDADEEEQREAARHRGAVARGEEEPTEEEQTLANDARIEAEAQFREHERRRPERIEQLLADILRAVQVRR